MIPPTYDPAWPDDVKALYHHDMREMWDPTIAPHIWSWYHDHLDRYRALAGAAPKRILDVGCAQGTLALLLAEQGHEVTAVDIRPQFLEYAQSRYSHGNIRFLQANALEDELPGDFDLVFANQIIEHLVYPVQFLERLRRLLVPGGMLVATTPNGEYLKNSLPSYEALGDPADWEHMQFSADGDGHFFAYRRRELLKIFADAGFDAARCEYFETPFINGHLKLRYLHRGMPNRPLRWVDRGLLRFGPLASRLSHQLLASGANPR